MKTNLLNILCITMITVLCACDNNAGPESVASDFWKAANSGDEKTARELISKASKQSFKMKKESSGGESEVKFGTATEKDGVVSIPTTMINKVGGQSSEVPMTTILVQEDGVWKVDWNRTVSSMFGGMMGELQKGMEEAMEELGEKMKKALSGQPPASATKVQPVPPERDDAVSGLLGGKPFIGENVTLRGGNRLVFVGGPDKVIQIILPTGVNVAAGTTYQGSTSVDAGIEKVIVHWRPEGAERPNNKLLLKDFKLELDIEDRDAEKLRGILSLEVSRFQTQVRGPFIALIQEK